MPSTGISSYGLHSLRISQDIKALLRTEDICDGQLRAETLEAVVSKIPLVLRPEILLGSFLTSFMSTLPEVYM